MGQAKQRQREELELLAMAAPILAVMAFRGGSLFAKQWVDRVRKLGVIVEDPDESNLTTE